MDNVEKMILDTYNASFSLQQAGNDLTRKILRSIAQKLQSNASKIIKANHRDIIKQDPEDPRVDRLLLNRQRIQSIADAIETIASLPCPAGNLLSETKLANGLLLQKRSVPLGVVAAVYESRPNVTFDIAALCIRSKNACLLKGSKEAEHTNKAAVTIIHEALKENGLSTAIVGLLPTDRAVLEKVFVATRYIDVIIPRGSQGLIQHVRKNSRVPLIETGAGVCHIYVEKEADLQKAVRIVENAKVSRPSVCNAVDTILVDEDVVSPFLSLLAPRFGENKVEIFADQRSYALLKGYPYLKKATPEHYGEEYLSLKCSIKIVRGMEEALQHIRKYSTRHSEAIISKNKKICQQFTNLVDAAVVYSNASTRFTDGEEFGLGAEIGISTQKLHARGPFALEKLVSEKWIVKGNGQIR
ncbi:MAG: glutamate-5-semialdehyde dehydrogenase [Flavisolibacter sp.]